MSAWCSLLCLSSWCVCFLCRYEYYITDCHCPSHTYLRRPVPGRHHTCFCLRLHWQWSTPTSCSCYMGDSRTLSCNRCMDGSSQRLRPIGECQGVFAPTVVRRGQDFLHRILKKCMPDLRSGFAVIVPPSGGALHYVLLHCLSHCYTRLFFCIHCLFVLCPAYRAAHMMSITTAATPPSIPSINDVRESFIPCCCASRRACRS